MNLILRENWVFTPTKIQFHPKLGFSHSGIALSLRKPDSLKRTTATNHQIVEPHSIRKGYYRVAACRHVVILLRFCALGSAVGVYGITVLIMRPYLRGGANPILGRR